MHPYDRSLILPIALIGLILLGCTDDTFAGTGGSSEFGNIYTLLTGWLRQYG